MRKYSFAPIVILLLSWCASPGPALEESLHTKIMQTHQAIPPHVYGNHVFFTFRPERTTRYVGIAFAHEEFRNVHLFEKNEKGVFFFAYPIPPGRTYLEYRLVIDGLWTTDPLNPLQVEDSRGISISRFEFPLAKVVSSVRSPVVRAEERTVVFNFRAEPGKDVFLTGTFARWDPYLYRMTEVEPGFYTLSLRLLPGTYYYAFYVDGKRVPDPLNKEWRKSPEGHVVSLFSLPPVP